MFDLDKAVEGFMLWDFPVVIDGKQYETRSLRFRDLFALADLDGAASPEAMRRMGELLKQIVVDGPADVLDWELDRVSALLAAVQDYAQRRAKKNAAIRARTSGGPRPSLQQIGEAD